MKMEDISSNWQKYLNDGLVNRLTRPLHKPGMMKMAMSQRIINNSNRFLNRLPLLSQQMQRWGNINTTTSDAVPIIYAQPVSLVKDHGIETTKQNSQPNISQNQPSAPVVQRKLDSSQFLGIKPANNAIASEDKDLSNSNFLDDTTPSLTLETQVNQTSSSSSDIPVVPSQPISSELTNNSEISLQTKYIDSNSFSPNSFELNSPLENSSSPNSSELNPNPTTSSTQNEIITTNQISNTSSEIPVVSSQPISSELTNNSEIPLQAKFIDSNSSSANSSISSSSIPVTSPLNIPASPKQNQQGNYPENINSIRQENFTESISANNLPIVTSQTRNFQIYSTEEDISFTKNYSNYLNQSNKISNNISNSQINHNHSNQKNYPLPIVSVISPVNSTLKHQPLPLVLAKNISSSNNISHKPSQSKQNPIISNTDSSSSHKIFDNPSFTKETNYSTGVNQSNTKIDVDNIANIVERKLMRRLVIESERRGKIR